MPIIHLLLAAATATVTANATPYNDGAPPQRFRDDVTVSIDIRDQAGIDSECHAMFGAPPPGMKTNACYTGKKVIMPNPCSFPKTDTYAHMLCHELGHANGWPSTHGD